MKERDEPIKIVKMKIEVNDTDATKFVYAASINWHNFFNARDPKDLILNPINGTMEWTDDWSYAVYERMNGGKRALRKFYIHKVFGKFDSYKSVQHFMAINGNV